MNHELDEDNPLWLVNEQVKGLLEGDGASEDHEDVIEFFKRTGLPDDTVRRIHRAIVHGDKKHVLYTSCVAQPDKIKFQDQEFPHDPENGIFGDCFRATLATLLGLEISEVPHFLHDNCDGKTFHHRLNKFLSKYGFFYLSLSAANWDLAAWKDECGIDKPIYHEICDDSPRFPGTGHAVVGCDGVVVHDPHPTKLGLPKVTDARSFGFIVKLSH